MGDGVRLRLRVEAGPFDDWPSEERLRGVAPRTAGRRGPTQQLSSSPHGERTMASV